MFIFAGNCTEKTLKVKLVNMNLQEFINKKHTHYLIGYIEDDEFWSVNECGSLKSAFEMIEHHKILSKTKRDYLIIEKQITYKHIKNENI